MQYWLFFHILGVILWAGGALNVSRMLGFHVQEDPETVQPRLSNIEKRIFNLVVLPGMAMAMIAGMGMLTGAAQADMQYGWMHGKLAFAMILFVLTMLLGKRIQDLAAEPKLGKKGKHMALHGMIGLCVAGILYCVFIARAG
jgi:uncharacterized membrane protein